MGETIMSLLFPIAKLRQSQVIFNLGSLVHMLKIKLNFCWGKDRLVFANFAWPSFLEKLTSRAKPSFLAKSSSQIRAEPRLGGNTTK